MATVYSTPASPAKRRFATTIIIFTATMAFADEALNTVFAARAAAEFHRAQAQYQAATTNSTVVWQFARACFNFADFATNNAQRAVLAHQGIDACRQLIAREAKSAPAHYYLAMNLGQLARTESIGALKLVKEMEPEFKTALDLDAQLDFGGPARSLGLLYRDAPGWPVSIGSKHKARNYLEQAVKIAPDFPENILNLIESDLKWRDSDDAKKRLETLDALWPKAKTNFTGEGWERDWADWTARREAVREKLDELSTPLKPPRNSG